MTDQHLAWLFLRYDEHLAELDVRGRRDGLPLQHLRWMCKEVINWVAANNASAPDPASLWETETGLAPLPAATRDKMMRWLGFIQGVLFSQLVFTVEQMRDHSRSLPDDEGTKRACERLRLLVTSSPRVTVVPRNTEPPTDE